MASPANMSAQNIPNNGDDQTPSQLLKEYILERDPGYRELLELKEKVSELIQTYFSKADYDGDFQGWRNPAGDEHFRHQRQRADNSKSNPWQALNFYSMMQRIGDELQQSTSALTPRIGILNRLRVLDLCMAPGGYSASALRYNPDAILHGISLPLSQGGHKLLLDHPDLHVVYTDITMLAAEFSASIVPTTHPDAETFSARRPFHGQSFHLVFCDGQVLRTHPRGPHREVLEPLRLTVSQLILALQRIEAGGTLIILLHKADTWRNFLLLYKFGRFSDVELFKPARKHADRSSFYLVAKNVQPGSPLAREALDEWRAAWWRATLGGESGTGQLAVMESDETVERLILEFGTQYLSLVRPIFDLQRRALAQKDYVR